MAYLAMLAAILSAVFMAAVMLNDAIFLKGKNSVMSDPLQMLVVSSIFPLIALMVTLTSSVPSKYTIAAFFVGALWTVSNAAFFQVTKMTNDFTLVSLLDASYPIFMGLLGLLFGIGLSPRYWGGVILGFASLAALAYFFRGEREEVENPRLYYGLLVIHVGGLIGAMFGFDFLLTQVGEAHYSSLSLPYLAGQTVGLLALLSPTLRANFRADWPKIRRFWPALLVGEVSFVASLICLTWAMKVYPGAVSAALGGSYPLLIFLAGPQIRRVEFFRRFGDMNKTFPPQEGPMWKKAIVILGNIASLGMLAPQTPGKPVRN